MSLEVTPELLPVTSAQLGAAMTETLQSVSTAAPFAIPAPPGADIISLMIFVKAEEHAAKFFPFALQGIGCGTDAAAVLPTIGADYALTDALGDVEVAMQSARL